MEIITKSSKIDNVLVRLMKKYKHYYIASAWASLGSNASKKLLLNKNRINKMVVGTHFYQTHPNFIEEFIDSQKVQFILNTSGIYHPKVYLFSNENDDWECIIGSANFTSSALSKNSEIVIHIKSTDDNSSTVYRTIVDKIDDYWSDSSPISRDEFQNYKNQWEINIKKIRKLSGKYGKNDSSKSLINSNIFSLSWSKYFERIQTDNYHSFDDRLVLLDTVQSYFKNNQHFADMNEVKRRQIAGIATENISSSRINWGWFGSMIGAGRFKNRNGVVG